MNFFGSSFNDKPNKVVNSIFPNLNSHHQNILSTYLIQIINFIAIKFNFDPNKKEDYVYQFTQNNNKDMVGLLLMLLPYINDDTNTKKSKLTSFDELYIKKTENVDINNISPNYEFTNLQYGRCKRVVKQQNIIGEEIPFNEEHLKDNFELLKDTVKSIANKLYVNWTHIRPFPLTYEDTQLFKLLNNQIQNKTLDLDNSGEIYNTLTNYVYKDILDIRWILYDLYDKDKTYKFTYMLNKLVNIKECIKNTSWITLDQKEKDLFDNEWLILVNAFNNNQDLNNISNSNIELIMKAIASYGKYDFIKNNENYDKDAFNAIIDKVDIDEDSEMKKITTNNVKKFIMSITPQIVYEYFTKCFFKLSKMWFSHYYLTYVDDHYELNSIKESLMSLHESQLRTKQVCHN